MKIECLEKAIEINNKIISLKNILELEKQHSDHYFMVHFETNINNVISFDKERIRGIESVCFFDCIRKKIINLEKELEEL